MKRDMITMSFRGRTRTFPVESFAMAFRRDPETTRWALGVLVFGPPEHRTDPTALPAQTVVTIPVQKQPEPTPSDNQRAATSRHSSPRMEHQLTHGEGGKGGGVGTFPKKNVSNNINVSETIRNVPNEGSKAHVRETNDTANVTLPENSRRAEEIAFTLDDTKNVTAIEQLVRAHPKALLDESLKRTVAVPDARVRGTRGALFTGIVRRLARSSWKPPHS